MSVEVRGFVARNGQGTLCYFPWREADGIPLTGDVLAAAEEARRDVVQLDDLPSHVPDGPSKVRTEVDF